MVRKRTVEERTGSRWLPSRLRTVDSFLAFGVVFCCVGPLEVVGSGLRERVSERAVNPGLLHHVNDDMVTASW